MKKILIIVLLSLAVLGLSIIFSREKKVTTGFVTNVSFNVTEDLFFIHEIVKYPTNVTVVKLEDSSEVPIGITGDPWNINFGVLPVGVRGKRTINIANYKQPVFRIKIVCYGDICHMITFDKNDFLLHEGEEAQVVATLDTSLSPFSGDYKGEIDVISDRPKYSFISSILGWS